MTQQIAVRIPSQHIAAEGLAQIFEASPDPTALKLGNPAIWAPRQDITKLLFRHHLFQQVLNVQGSIIECGVGHGGGLFAWLHFSAIHEPVNHQRTVIGFDTFEGFPALTEQDAASTSEHAHPGGLAVDSHDQILAAAAYHNANRPLPNITKLDLIRGDACDTIPEYVAANPHLLVSLLYLDFDLYEPTRVALEHFLPRMPAGALVAFDEVNIPDWPGETQALLDAGVRLRLQRVPWGPTTCYAVL
jgi:hypothetical protein